MISKEAYPKITISLIKDPNRFWATPILGGLIKIIILIPIGLEIVILFIWAYFVSIVNSFFVLTKGEYWDYSYRLNLGIFKLILKSTFFFAGLTNKYPGFKLQIDDSFSLEIKKPQNPNKLFALPIIGGIGRIVLLIPFAIYTEIIQNGARIGIIASSIPVLLKGRYPESTFEMTRDSTRLSFSQGFYFLGLSDKYPNFKISMNHRTIKTILIILGAILFIANLTGS